MCRLWDEKYGIINHIPNILWIISGREVLECKIKSNHWKDNIFDVELKDFDKIEQDEKIDYARFFLDKTPIVENNIKNTIKEVSGGLPFHLHLCVEYYMELKGNGEQPKEEDFQKNFTELLEKFVKYLDAEEKNLIYLLVCIGRWKRRDLYDRKYKKYFEKFYAIIDNVLGFSFVICDGEEYYFHQKAYDILKRNSPEYVKIICQEYMDKKYELNDISERERLTFIQNRIIDEVSQIGNNNLIEDVDKLINSFENNSIYLKEFIIERKYMAFEQIYKTYYKLINHCNISNKKVAEVVVNIYAIYTQYLEQREDHKRAFDNQSKVIEIVEEYLKDNIDLYLNERYQMLSIQLFLKKDKNWFIELTNLKEDCEKKLKSDSELTKVVTRLWNYYAMISNLQYDIDTVEQFAEEEIRQYGINSSRGIKIQMDLAYAYKLHGQYDKAIEIGEKVVSDMKNIFGEGDRDYINAMDNLAIAYRKRGEELQKKGVLNENNEDFKKMIKYGLEVYRLGKIYVNKDTVDYAGYLYQIIICHVYQNKFIEAKDYCIEALNLKLFKEMDYPYKACVYDTIARAYNDEGNLRKGAYYINKYYELVCVNLGANSELAYSLKQTRDLLRMNIKK